MTNEPKPLPPGVERLPSGRFRAKLRDPTREGAWMPGGNFATPEEAADYRRGLLAELAELLRDGTVAGDDSLQAFGDAWLDERELAGDTRSIETFRSQWRHVSGTALARLALHQVTAEDVRAWLDATLQKRAQVAAPGGGHKATARRVSRSTVMKVLSMLRQIFERAVEKGRVSKNPARDVRVKKVARATADDVWTHLTLAEIERLHHCTAIPENYRITYLVAVYTGLRQGELWGLHWRDVRLDGDRPEITVRFSRRGAPKNGKVRRVPLLAPAVELLNRWREIAPKSEEGLTFPTRTGEMRAKGDDARWADYHAPKMVDGKRVNVRCDGQSKKLQLGRPCRFHDLRHTCASHLIMGSWGVAWTLSEIAAFLGHSDTEVTEIYAHLSPEHLHAKAALTARRGTIAGVPRTAPHPTETLARPRGLEPLTSRSVAPGEPLGASRVTAQMERLWNTARAVVRAVADGAVPESAVLDLLEAVEGLPLVTLARQTREAQGKLRARAALSLALEALEAHDRVSQPYGCADSADSADSEVLKCS